MLRGDPNDVLIPGGPPRLPAPASVIVAALAPLLTPQRLGRIEAVVAGRTRAVVPVLDGLIDPHNIAAVLRSADAFGVQDVHIIEGPDAFTASHRVAQGSERWLDLVRHPDARTCANHLRARGYHILVADMRGGTTPDRLQNFDKLAVVFGNEHAGVSRQMSDFADDTYTIPMRGFVESLNVSVANAITLEAAVRNRPGDLDEPERLALRARFMMLSVERADAIIAEYLRRRT